MSAAADRARAWLNRAPVAVPADPAQQAEFYRRVMHEAEQHLRDVLGMNPPWAKNQEAPVPLPEAAHDHEREAAVCESAEYHASDAYFKPREEWDSRSGRRLFAAGFVRGWSAKSEDKS